MKNEPSYLKDLEKEIHNLENRITGLQNLTDGTIGLNAIEQLSPYRPLNINDLVEQFNTIVANYNNLTKTAGQQFIDDYNTLLADIASLKASIDNFVNSTEISITTIIEIPNDIFHSNDEPEIKEEKLKNIRQYLEKLLSSSLKVNFFLIKKAIADTILYIIQCKIQQRIPIDLKAEIPNEYADIIFSKINQRINNLQNAGNTDNSVTELKKRIYMYTLEGISSSTANSNDISGFVYDYDFMRTYFVLLGTKPEMQKALSEPELAKSPQETKGPEEEFQNYRTDCIKELEKTCNIKQDITPAPDKITIIFSSTFGRLRFKKITLEKYYKMVTGLFDSDYRHNIRAIITGENIKSLALPNWANIVVLILNNGIKSLSGGDYSTITELILPPSVQLAPGSFSSCDNLKTVISYGAKRISKNVCRSCKNLENVILHKGLTDIGDRAFYECPSLISLSLPDGLINIDRYAFYECSSLTDVKLPNGVTNIGECAFSGCPDLSCEIPASVESIGDRAFSEAKEILLPQGLKFSSFGITKVTVVPPPPPPNPPINVTTVTKAALGHSGVTPSDLKIAGRNMNSSPQVPYNQEL